MSDIDTMPRQTIPDLLPGTLDLLILRTLQTDVMHGWAISERIQQISRDVLQINQGSLYPALHRLEHQGWIEAEWRVSELGRRAKYYRLTASGRRQLAVEASEWERMSTAIDRVMNAAGQAWGCAPSKAPRCGRASSRFGLRLPLSSSNSVPSSPHSGACWW